MTPTDLNLITDSAAALDPEPFAACFYDTLFELAPAARALFPDDLREQRAKLMNELTTLIGFATSAADGDVDRFVARAHRLGARHTTYGAEPEHYDIVGAALLAALRDHVTDWSDPHETAWSRLYRLVATTMQEGATLSA